MAPDNLSIAAGVLEALERPDAQYQQQSLSATALEACSRASNQLKALKLDNQELKVINNLSSLDAAHTFVSKYVTACKETGLKQKGWKKVYAVSRFAGPVLNVFKEANFSPECSLALGLPLNNKSEIEERLETEMGQLADILNQAQFSQSMNESAEIATEADGLCAAVIDFLIHALHYQKKSSLVKVLSAILLDYSRRFQSFIDKIRQHAAKIERLAQQSYTTVLISSKDVLNQTASATEELRKWAVAHAINFDCRMTRLEASVIQFQTSITELRTYEAVKYIHEIDTILSPTSSESLLMPLREHERVQNLAPKEQWQNFGSRIQFPDWARIENAPVLWISGPVNRRDACWVSSLSFDIIEALEAERGVDVASVLCNRGDDNEPMSALAIFNSAIVQFLKVQPENIFQRPFIDFLSLQVIREARCSIHVSFGTLAKLLKILGERNLGDGREMFFVIDRIDLCSPLRSKAEGKRFLQSLLKLNEAVQNLRIIVTSSTPAPDLPTLENGRQNFAEIWVDPYEPIAMHSR